MGKLKLPRGLYLQHRTRADGQILFRWGHAPRLRAAGIRPFDLFADGEPLTEAHLADLGLPAGTPPPTGTDGRPLLHDGRAHPLALKQAIEAAKQLTDALAENALPTPATNSEAARPVRAPARARAASRGSGRGSGRAPEGRIYTVGDLLAAFFSPANARLDARQADTIRSYRSWRAPVDEIFADEPCANMDEDLIEDWFHVQRAARGHRMAYGGYQLLRRAWNWGRRRYRLHEIIWTEIDAPKPPAKIRVGTQLELTYLLRAMDDPASLLAELQLAPEDGPPARPTLGDSFVMAIWTTQRARDVLAFTDHTIQSGRIRYRASKNDTRIDMPIIGQILPARIAAAKARRAARACTTQALIVHPDKDATYTQKTHGKHFREARALAARFVPSLIGEGVDDWGDPHQPFTFEDCRDTGITRLLRAGCDIEQIRSWSNHKSAASLRAVADAYMAIDGEIADAAGDKLDTYVTGKGFAV